MSDGDRSPWVTYVGPLGRPRRLKVDISADELVSSLTRVALQRRWPDLPDDAAIDAYTLDEVSAEKVRCIVERLQCRDLYDMHELLDGGHVDALDAWHLYLRKAENDLRKAENDEQARSTAHSAARMVDDVRATPGRVSRSVGWRAGRLPARRRAALR